MVQKRISNYTLALDSSPVSKRIIKHGVYEPKETALIKKHLKHGDNFLDIGAHIGYYTIMAAMIVGMDAGMVHAFEPAADNFRILSKNVADNRCRNVCTYHMGLGEPNGRIKQTLYLDPLNSGNHKLYQDSPTEGITSAKIFPFDEIFPSMNATGGFKIIKIDTQGAEVKVLSGMDKTIRAHNKLIMMIEFYPFGLIKMGNHPGEIFEFLWDHGFQIFDIKNGLSKVRAGHTCIGRYIGRKFTNLWCVK